MIYKEFSARQGTKPSKSGKNSGKNDYDVVAFDDAGFTVELFLDTETRLPVMAETIENDYMLGDVTLTAVYANWNQVGRLMVPGDVKLKLEGIVIYEETRSTISVSDIAQDSAFPLQNDKEYSNFDAQRGLLSSQWYRRMMAIGWPFDDYAWFTTIYPKQIADDVIFFPDIGDYNSLAVRRDDGIILIDPTIAQHRSEVLLEKLQEAWPDTPISKIIITHHHFDHMGGLRTLAASGPEIIHSVHAGEITENVLTRKHSVLPDRLSDVEATWSLTTVDETGMQLGEGGKAIQLIQLDNPKTEHAKDMLIIHMPWINALYVADFFSPNMVTDEFDIPMPLVWEAEELQAFLKDRELDIDLFIGGHGSTGDSDLLQLYIDRGNSQ